MHLDETVTHLTGRHYQAVKQPTLGSKDKFPAKQCRVCNARGLCTAKGHPMKTVHICKDCSSKPGLHVEVAIVCFFISRYVIFCI